MNNNILMINIGKIKEEMKKLILIFQYIKRK